MDDYIFRHLWSSSIDEASKISILKMKMAVLTQKITSLQVDIAVLTEASAITNAEIWEATSLTEWSRQGNGYDSGTTDDDYSARPRGHSVGQQNQWRSTVECTSFSSRPHLCLSTQVYPLLSLSSIPGIPNFAGLVGLNPGLNLSCVHVVSSHS